MRYLRKYNEDVTKESIAIEDMLIEFEDSGELISSYVDDIIEHYYVGKVFYITLKYAEECVGFKKLELLDKIINRLKRKFKYILIGASDDIIVTNIKMNIGNKKFIDYNLTDKVRGILEWAFSDLKKFTKEGRELIEYGTNSFYMTIQYNPTLNRIFVHKDIMEKLNGYSLNNKDLVSIFDEYAQRILGIKVFRLLEMH